MKSAKSATRARAKPTVRSARSAARALRLTVQYATSSRNLPTEAQFTQWVRAALRAEAEITVRLVGLNEARDLNRAYGGNDHATNVLTFVLRESPPYHGDVAMCAPVVAKEARTQGKTLAAHYAHLTVHGVLHLQGYVHENEPEALAMEKLETRILKRLGYPDPYSTKRHHGRHAQ
jgi:probable rRNA maturation factor